MAKQKYMNGYWIGRTLYISPLCLSVFYFAPLILLILLCLSLIIKKYIIIGVIIMLYIAIGLVEIIKHKKNINKYLMILPILLFAIHITYGIGITIGLVDGIRKNMGNI